MREPRDHFNGKSVGEVKSRRLFKMWHSKRKRNTGDPLNPPSFTSLKQAQEFHDKRRKGGQAGGKVSKIQADIVAGMSDSDILKQLENYLSPPKDGDKSRNIRAYMEKMPLGPMKKGFQKAREKVLKFIKIRREAQKSSDWALDKPWATNNSNKYEEDYCI